MLTTKRECNKSNNLIRNSTLVPNLLTSFKITSKTSILRVKLNITKKCRTCSKSFQVLWKHSWQNSCTRMQSESIGSFRIEMTTSTQSILRSWKLKSTLKERQLLKLGNNLILFVSLWTEWFTTLQQTDTLSEDRWLIMTLLLTRLQYFMTILLGLMYQCLSMTDWLSSKFLINSQISKKIYKRLLKIKMIMKSMKSLLVMLLQVIM